MLARLDKLALKKALSVGVATAARFFFWVFVKVCYEDLPDTRNARIVYSWQ
jgi:hypothetical protein